MRTYLKSAYYLSELGELDYYCANVGNFIVVVKSVISVWKLVGKDLIFQCAVEHNFPHSPSVLVNDATIPTFPDLVIDYDFLYELSDGVHELEFLDYYPFQKRNLPKKITNYYKKMDKILKCYDMIYSLYENDNDKKMEVGSELKGMLFGQGVCFGRIGQFYKDIKKKYRKLTKENEDLIDFFYNEYPDEPGVLYSRY